MYRLDYRVIVTALLCFSHANSVTDVDVNLDDSGRPRLIRSLASLSNVSGTAENISTPKKTVSQANQLEEIQHIFSDKVEQLSKNPQIHIEGTVSPGLMEGGGGADISKFTQNKVAVDNNITTPSNSPSTEMNISKQNMSGSSNVDNTHRSVGRPGVSETIDKAAVLDKLDLGLPLASAITEDTKSSKIHARKGAENKKINARKGVDVNTTIPGHGVALDHQPSNTSGSKALSDPIQISTTTLSTLDIESQMNITSQPASVNITHKFNSSLEPRPHIAVNSSNSAAVIPQQEKKLNQVSKLIEADMTNGSAAPISLSINGTWSSTLSTVAAPKIEGGIISSFPLLKKTPRPKPLITVDKNSDAPVFQGRTPSQHDYVIPIVVAILAVPMVIVLLLFLYKKGSESWERRHYRRMDFLIDGMYND